MHTYSRRRPLLALAFLLTSSLAALSARAQVVSVNPSPAPTIITTAPYTINQAGYYQLGADLGVSATSGAIITVNASNVTLDFGGHYIVGPNTPSSTLVGVLITEQGNVNVQNGTIAFCYQGINFNGNGSASSIAINEQVRNMLVSRCFFEAIRLANCSGSTVSDCRVSFTGGSTFTTSTAHGLYTNGGTGNQFINTAVTSTTTTAAGAGTYAIYAPTFGAAVTNCTVNTATATGSSGTAYGIYNPAFAVGNTITYCQYGIYYALKYKDNLTLDCTTPFVGGTAVGSNN